MKRKMNENETKGKMDEDQKKDKYPSQVKYEKNNPTITIRMKLYEKEKIQKMAKKTGKNISMLIRIALLNLEKDFTNASNQVYNQGFKEGYSQGYEKGKKDWRIEYPCCICTKPIYIKPNSDSHKEIITYLKDNRWGHKNCFEQ